MLLFNWLAVFAKLSGVFVAKGSKRANKNRSIDTLGNVNRDKGDACDRIKIYIQIDEKYDDGRLCLRNGNNNLYN